MALKAVEARQGAVYSRFHPFSATGNPPVAVSKPAHADMAHDGLAFPLGKLSLFTAVSDGDMTAVFGIDAFHHAAENSAVRGSVADSVVCNIIMYEFVDDDILPFSVA